MSILLHNRRGGSAPLLRYVQRLYEVDVRSILPVDNIHCDDGQDSAHSKCFDHIIMSNGDNNLNSKYSECPYFDKSIVNYY